MRVTVDAASSVIRSLAGVKVDGRKFMPSRAFFRGAGFGGHRQALEHEARLLERAAADKHAHAARLRDKLQKSTEATTVSKGKSAAFLGAYMIRRRLC